MKVSYNWLKELVDFDKSPEELGDLFTLKSQEVAGVEKMVDATNLTVGHVLSKEKHPDANKLNICQVDVASSVLQIVCGAPNVEVGQKVIVSLVGAVLPGNFKIKKSKIRGVESFGMICSLAELGIEKKYVDADGIHVLPADTEVGSDPIKALCFDDYVIELDLTPNRGDLLSMIGVAYDTQAIANGNVTMKTPSVIESDEVNPVAVSIETDDCLSYHARVIKNVEIKESPQWLKARLIAGGIRPISNVVDITNYILLEYGQPLHSFDYDKLKSDEIVVRKAKDNESIITLDNQKRELITSDIVITNGSKAVALGGVMGGFDTEVDDNTTSILLESAVFNYASIRKTSRRLGLISEASIRYERKVNPEKTKEAMEKATQLYIELCNGVVLKGISCVDNVVIDDSEIVVSLEKINRTLGRIYTKEELHAVFTGLAFTYREQDGMYYVRKNSRRQDVQTVQDVIEEIVRIDGYDKIPLTIPNTESIGLLTQKQKTRKLIRNVFVNMGFHEVITYSLVNENCVFDFVKEQRDILQVARPLSSDRSTLRQSQLNGICDVLKYNLARKEDNIAVVEVGNVFEKHGEREVISGALTGLFSKTLWQGKKEIVDFFLVKGIIDSVLSKLSINNVSYVKAETNNSTYHPGQYAHLYINDDYLGLIAMLHPKYTKENDLKETIVFELEFDTILANVNKMKRVQEVSKYPRVSRDLAIVVDRDIASGKIIDVVKAAGKKMLIDVRIFDVYVGENVLDSQKSIALNLMFQDSQKTLSNEEIDARVNQIIKKLGKELNATLR